MYGTVAGAAALIPGVGPINTTSTPPASDVQVWLGVGSGYIDAGMSDGGYIVPVDNPTAAIIPLLDGLANLYAAATILQARGVDTLTGGSEDRSVEMYDRFFKSLKELLDRDLSRLGVGSVSTTDPSWRRLRTFQTVKVDGYSQANEY